VLDRIDRFAIQQMRRVSSSGERSGRGAGGAKGFAWAIFGGLKASLRGFAGVRKGHFAGFETSERVTWAVFGERKGSHLGLFQWGEVYASGVII
jgi:hypothetical protein